MVKNEYYNMRLLSKIVCIIIYLNLVTSDHGFDLVKSPDSHLYDDSMELASTNEKRSLETKFDLSKNTKTTNDDFSLGEEKETSDKESGMSLEASDEDPLNKVTQQPKEQEKNNNVLTTNPLDVTLPSSTTKINSLDIIEKITTADMDLFNDETTIKMVNEGLAFVMRTIPTNINNNQEDLITTSSPKEIMNDRNLESDDKSDMSLDISNEDGKEKINNNTTRDDVQFDIGDEDSNEDQNSKIVVRNNDQVMNSSSVVDIQAAEDITVPFNAADAILTTEDPIEAKNNKIHNILLNEEINATESEPNSMEVKQSTIFVGPSITTTHLPLLNKEEEEISEVFVVDENKEVFSDVSSTTSPHIEEKNSETIAHLSTSLTVSSAEEKSSSFPDSSEFTELTSTVIIPKILSTTLEPTDKSIDDRVMTTLLQEVDFSKTTGPSIIDDVSSTKNNLTTSNTIDEEIMTTINELLTTQFPEGENMTFDEKVIQSKENVEGDIKKANNNSDEDDDEGIILNHESINLSTTTTTNSTSTTTTSSTTTTTTTTTSSTTSLTNISTTIALNETSPITITPENIAIEIIKNLQSEIANKTNEDNLTFAGFLFSTPISDYIIPIIIIISIIFIIIIILLLYITVSNIDIDTFLHIIRIKNNIIGFFLDIYDFLKCKKRKENGMLRFTNSQTSSTLSKIEEGVNMDHVNDYKYHDNSRVSVSSIPNEKDVNLVGFGPVDGVSKSAIGKRR
uniref:ShKT domain-containing protein n=1 Tax=Strongyloides venezuelensis TaxID=75913 RepID=A0A0K0G4C8_STRVS